MIKNKSTISKRRQEDNFKRAYALAFGNKPKEDDWEIAFSLWMEVAICGHKRSQFYVGVCYDHGNGVDKNITQAYKWFLKAAEQGHSGAQYNVGFFYRTGEVVKQDLKKAVYWYKLSALQGDDEAQRDLGYNYFYGYGVKRDMEKAVYWYRKSAQQNNARLVTTWDYAIKKGKV